MEYIKLKDAILGKYDLNITLYNNTSYLVYSKNKEYINRFLYALTGINKIDNIYHNSSLLFENENYFKNRIYLDFNSKNLPTLNSKLVQNNLSRLNITLDVDKFKEAINEVNLRKEIHLKNDYTFTNVGEKLASYVLLKSTNFKNIIIANPYFDDKNFIINEITNKQKYNNIIIGSDKLSFLSNYVDKILILTDYNTIIEVDKNSKFIICDDNIYLNNRIFKKDNITISLDNYPDYKPFRKIKYKKLSFKELIKYLGDEDE